jgi:monovalent cation/hydrogen antiporter
MRPCQTGRDYIDREIMLTLELVLILVAAAAALQLLAVRLRIPLPVLLVVGGGMLAVAPGLPRAPVDPDLLFLIFVPPLLYDGAQSASWREMRSRAAPILSLGVGLVLLTMVAVAVLAHAIIPGFTWPAAFALGAIVSPPDPVAASAVLRPLDVSRSIQTILEGEGLVNDATSLVAYRAAVAAAVSGTFSLGASALRIVLAGAVGIVIGLIVGRVVLWLGRRTARIPVVENALSLLIPYAAYIPADRIGASGVLAVVAAGLLIARESPRLWPAAARIQHESLWALVTFVLESLIFIFVGLQLPVVIHNLGPRSAAAVIGDTALVSIVCVVVRLAWAFPSAVLTRRKERARSNIWPEVLFIGWAGVRGADSLVIALALPLAMSGRPLVIVITFGVIIATLVVQGFTLGPAVRLLKIGGAGHAQDDREETRAWIATTDAALARLDRIAQAPSAATPAAREAIERLRDAYTRRRAFWLKGGRARLASVAPERDIGRQLLEDARAALVEQRDRGEIDDTVVRHVERYLDLQTMLLDYPEWDIDESPFEALAPPPTEG